MADHTTTFGFLPGLIAGFVLGFLVGGVAIIGQSLWEHGRYWGYATCQAKEPTDG